MKLLGTSYPPIANDGLSGDLQTLTAWRIAAVRTELGGLSASRPVRNRMRLL